MSTASNSQHKEEPEQKQEPKASKESSPSFKLTLDIVKVVSTVVGLAGAAYVMWNYSPEVVPHKVLQTFESGGKSGWDEGFEKDDATAVKRPGVEKKLAELFYPSPAGDLSALYILIVGEHGTGKSTAVRRVVHERKGVNGAIYVNVPDDTNLFGGVEASAVGLPPLTLDTYGAVIRFLNQDRGMPISEEPAGSWRKAAMAITQAASRFYDKHQRPAVLIIDSAELLAKKNPAFLEQLQVFAKQRTDEGSLRMVFVSSDGSVLEQLQSRSAWSRALDPFVVGDISDEDAVEFLKKKGVAEEQAEGAVRDITGGRFELLGKFAGSWAAKGNESTLQELFKATRDAVESVGVGERHPLFVALVAQQRIDRSPAKRLLGDKADTTLRALLDKNIIAAHPDLTFSFHSRHVESFFKRECSDRSAGGGGGGGGGEDPSEGGAPVGPQQLHPPPLRATDGKVILAG